MDQFSGTDVGVLIEEFTSQIKFIGEGLLGLNKKVDMLEVKVDKLGFRLDKIEIRLNKIEGDIEVIKMDIEIIKHDLKNEISRDEFIVLERRVALLENRS